MAPQSEVFRPKPAGNGDEVDPGIVLFPGGSPLCRSARSLHVPFLCTKTVSPVPFLDPRSRAARLGEGIGAKSEQRET